MLSIFKPKSYGFFELFERQAVTAIEATTVMLSVLKNPAAPDVNRQIGQIEEVEHQCDAIARLSLDLLRRTFICPFDRDDTLKLISGLDDIVDLVEACAHRIKLYEIKAVPAEVVELAEVLLHAQNKVLEMVRMMYDMKKNHKNIDTPAREINHLESEADMLHRSGIAALFRDYKHDPLMVMKLKEVYEMLESAVDACKYVSNIIEGLFIEQLG